MDEFTQIYSLCRRLGFVRHLTGATVVCEVTSLFQLLLLFPGFSIETPLSWTNQPDSSSWALLWDRWNFIGLCVDRSSFYASWYINSLYQTKLLKMNTFHIYLNLISLIEAYIFITHLKEIFISILSENKDYFKSPCFSQFVFVSSWLGIFTYPS